MKLPSQRLFVVLASAAALLAGCSKKPVRPDPSATVLGPQGGGASMGSLNPSDVGSVTPGATDLALRDSDFDANGQNRTALAADTVYFDFDRSDVKPSERPKLQAAKAYLDQHPNRRLVLEGHCDWRGTAEYNLALGDRRARAVKNYLQSLGVSPDRMDTLSKGSLEASKNADAATMAKDRRVNLIVVQSNAAGALPAAPAGNAPQDMSAPDASAPDGGGLTPPPANSGGL